MKKRLFCVLLGLLVGFSLPLSAMAIGGPIFTEPIEDLIPGVSLVQTTAPEGAVAVGYNLLSEETIYYRVNGATLDLPNGYPYHDELLDQGVVSPDAVIGNDDRTMVNNTQVMPYSAIACIDILYANGEGAKATAFMISPNVAMTAAHNLFNQNCSHDSANWAISVAVYPGTKNGSVPYGAGYAEEVVIGKSFYTESKLFHERVTEGGNFVCACESTVLSDYYDWGFILLDEPIGYLSGYFKYQFNSQTIGTDICFSAYKSINGANTLSAQAQYEQQGESIRTLYEVAQDLDQTYVMHYNLDTEDGQSGGPIFYYNATSNEYRVLAVHNVEHTPNGVPAVNQGCRITSQLYSFILAYTSLYSEPNPWE